MLDREKFAWIVAANGGELPQLAGGATEKVILRESKKTQEEWGPTEGGEEGAEKGGKLIFSHLAFLKFLTH